MGKKVTKQLTPRQAPEPESKEAEMAAETVEVSEAIPAGAKRYLVVKKSFIDNKLVHPGDEIFYSGKAGSGLQLIEDESED